MINNKTSHVCLTSVYHELAFLIVSVKVTFALSMELLLSIVVRIITAISPHNQSVIISI